MKIIGGHDYYDSGMAWGQDNSVVFLRNGDLQMERKDVYATFHLPKVLCNGRLSTSPKPNAIERSPGGRWASLRDEFPTLVHDNVEHVFSKAFVVLCGVLRRGLHVRSTVAAGLVSQLGERWIWSHEALLAYAEEHGLHVREGKDGTSKVWSNHWDDRLTVQIEVDSLSLRTWFEPVRLEGAARDAILDRRVTVLFRNPTEHARREDGKWKVMCRIDQAGLGDMGFAKAPGMDPYAVFQEISMWKGGVLPSDNPGMVEITDDKVKIAKHGFHHPTSFRRAKADAR